MSQTPDISIGGHLGEYKVGPELGRGGIAVVHEASHPGMTGPLAIKIAHRSSEQRDLRFVREFERTRVISLPGVPRVYDVGMNDALIWFVMDRVPGQPIHRLMRDTPSLNDRIEIALKAGAQMCEALAGIHRLGFIHRDVKPSNVLVSRTGETHLLDFGLVRLQERGDTLTRAGRLVGTVAFMSPEQTTGLPLTHKSDVFSAGLLLYEGLVGPRPRPARAEEWLGRMCLQQVTPMSIKEPGIPRALSTVVERMLALDPHARPTAQEAAAMLRAVKNSNAPADWPNPPKFIGREEELEQCFSAFQPNHARLIIIEGNVGTGRRRLLEQCQRKALLYGTPRVSGVCRPQISGGAVVQILTELFETHADPDWRVKAAGADVGTLLSMWPSLPLPTPPPAEQPPTLRDVAEAAASTIHRAVEDTGLMVVFERLDQVDSLSARVIQLLLHEPPDRLAVMAVMEPRWASRRANKLADHLELTDRATRIRLSPLNSPQATELAACLNNHVQIDPIAAATPMMARDSGLSILAETREETRATLPPQLAVLGLASFPLPASVLHLLGIDPSVWLQQGALRLQNNGYVLADNWLRQRAQALIAKRDQTEDALADALVRSHIEVARSSNIARHMLHGRDPNRALPHAIRAAVDAALKGRFTEARDWLIIIDPLKRDKTDATYKALRFELAWARAQTALRTDLSRVRTDLVAHARERAQTEADRHWCELLEAELEVRQGRHSAAIHTLLNAPPAKDPTINAWRKLKAARISIDQGKSAGARPLMENTGVLGAHPNRALIGIDMALLEGRPGTALEGCRQAIARGGNALGEPYLGTFLLRQAWALLAVGDRTGATQSAHQARDLLGKHGHRARHTEALHLVALLALGRGQLRAARVLLDPMITAAHSLGMTHLEGLGAALKLRVAAAMNDKGAARAILSVHTSQTQDHSPDWRLSQARWHRVQRQLPQAVKAAVWEPPRTPAAVFLTIEAARLQMATGDDDKARTIIETAKTVSVKRGFKELSVLANLVAGAIDHLEDTRWPRVLQEARESPWVELSLTAHAMIGHRALKRGDTQNAQTQFKMLLQRAEHLDHHYHRVVANEVLIKL